MESLFKTAEGKKEILKLYEQKLAELAIEFTYQTVATSFGKTNIIVTGKPSNPPIIVIHGSNGCAPIALETYNNLHKHFKVFAIDVLAQPNKSAETRLSMKDDSYGKWMVEVINALNIDNVTMAGFSFGGLVILKTLEFNETNIKEVFLSAPAYIVNGNPLKLLFSVFIPMRRFIKTQQTKYVEKFLHKVFTDRDAFAIQFLSKVFLHFKMDFTPVPVIKKQNANLITVPIHLFAGENDSIFPGKKMIKRAKKIFPSLVSVQLIENSKHVQNKTQNELIEKIIIATT